MKTLIATIGTVCALHFAAAASASENDARCSTQMLTGSWVFATGIGHQAIEGAPPPGDITAIGTMNISRNGDLEGVFDVTFEGAAFVPGIAYAGSAVVNPDCTGTISFVTATGTSRTDSIVVVSRYEFLGMSQDPSNLWTYQGRRLPGPVQESTEK